MMKINPYLNFDGNCEEAFNFYKSVFGGEFLYMGRFGEMPPQENMPTLSEEFKKRIMHVSLQVGETVLMGSDTGGDCGPAFIVGNNINLSISIDNKAEADKLFAALSNGGKIFMPMDEMFWGEYFGMLTDKFGVSWMINARESESM
ncbi:VOC family protein [Bacteroides sp.]|uniref:VOC family protein n=1 Tax=Bacteroides sp. TaxID=29523 RepID=UPI002629865F|nr:VOC family protein [Bacteroides sp.]MDD3038737.1 VOC family protein [Bacteroides sp.]